MQECMCAARRQAYVANPGREAAYNEGYRMKNLDQEREAARVYHAANPTRRHSRG